VAELDDGFTVRGETKISASGGRIQSISLDPADCLPLPETLQAIEEADIITFGPGSLFTSIVPNLLVNGVTDSIANSNAVKIYICNLMTQAGETADFTVADHVATLINTLAPATLDAVIVNSGRVSPAMRAKYRMEGAKPIPLGPTVRKIERSVGTRVASEKFLTVAGKRIPILNGNLIEETDVVRHSPAKLARAVFEAYDRRTSKIRKLHPLKAKLA
jgi:uncharacterized cofD-like protein